MGTHKRKARILVKTKPKPQMKQEKLCPHCGTALESHMNFCYNCGKKNEPITESNLNSKKIDEPTTELRICAAEMIEPTTELDLSEWKCGREFLAKLANLVFTKNENPHMGNYTGEDNRIAAVTEMLRIMFEKPEEASFKLGYECIDNYSSRTFSATNGHIEYEYDYDDDGSCYDGGVCSTGCKYTTRSYVKKISLDKYLEAKSDAKKRGISITETKCTESFEDGPRYTYMNNCHNLRGTYMFCSY